MSLQSRTPRTAQTSRGTDETFCLKGKSGGFVRDLIRNLSLRQLLDPCLSCGRRLLFSIHCIEGRTVAVRVCAPCLREGVMA